jgi:hypothetical protein
MRKVRVLNGFIGGPTGGSSKEAVDSKEKGISALIYKSSIAEAMRKGAV